MLKFLNLDAVTLTTDQECTGAVNYIKFNLYPFYLVVFRFLSRVELTELIDENKLLIRLGGTVSIETFYQSRVIELVTALRITI